MKDVPARMTDSPQERIERGGGQNVEVSVQIAKEILEENLDPLKQHTRCFFG